MYDIESLCRNLHLPSLKVSFKALIEEALSSNASHEEFLSMCLQCELNGRLTSAIKRRIKNARFPYNKTFDDFNWSALSLPIANQIRELQSLSFISEGRNVILIGNPGTGKTHISIALGMLAYEKGYNVLFSSIPNLVLELKESLKERQVVAYKKKFMSYDLIVLDELGYISFDKEGSELLFNLLSNRSEHKATIINTNLTFEKWPTLFGDTIMTTAMVDRLANKANIVNIVGESYRIKQTKQWLDSKK